MFASCLEMTMLIVYSAQPEWWHILFVYTKYCTYYTIFHLSEWVYTIMYWHKGATGAPGTGASRFRERKSIPVPDMTSFSETLLWKFLQSPQNPRDCFLFLRKRYKTTFYLSWICCIMSLYLTENAYSAKFRAYFGPLNFQMFSIRLKKRFFLKI